MVVFRQNFHLRCFIFLIIDTLIITESHESNDFVNEWLLSGCQTSQHSRTSRECEINKDSMMDSGSETDSHNPWAVIPYEPPKTLGNFHTEERVFNFAGKEITIVQKWQDLGVAAVVWDAVSH